MKKRLNQTQALALWMKSGKWIDLNIARKELGITRLPEIIRRLKASMSWLMRMYVEDETVTVNSRYGKTRIKRWRVTTIQPFKHFVKEFCK